MQIPPIESNIKVTWKRQMTLKNNQKSLNMIFFHHFWIYEAYFWKIGHWISLLYRQIVVYWCNYRVIGGSKVSKLPQATPKRLSRQYKYPWGAKYKIFTKETKTTRKTWKIIKNVTFSPFFVYLSKISKILSIQ